jgi:hypothetical protein
MNDNDNPTTLAQAFERVHELRERYELSESAADKAALRYAEKLRDVFISRDLDELFQEIACEKRDRALSARYGEAE